MCQASLGRGGRPKQSPVLVAFEKFIEFLHEPFHGNRFGLADAGKTPVRARRTRAPSAPARWRFPYPPLRRNAADQVIRTFCSALPSFIVD